MARKESVIIMTPAFLSFALQHHVDLLPADLYRVMCVLIGGCIMAMVCIRAFTRR